MNVRFKDITTTQHPTFIAVEGLHDCGATTLASLIACCEGLIFAPNPNALLV